MANKTDQHAFWRAFSRDLWRRIAPPVYQPSFVVYFLVLVVGVGGLGVWISLVGWIIAAALAQDTPAPDHAETSAALLAFARSLAGFAIPVLATAFADISLERDLRKSVVAFLFGLFLVGMAVSIPAHFFNNSMTAIPALVGLVLALFLWWIANATNDRLIEPTSSLGGTDLEQELPGGTSGLTGA